MTRPGSSEEWRRLGDDLGRLLARRLPTPADVEDVVQEILLRVWRRGDELREEERFGAWLSRIARTAVADQLRARQRHPLPRFAASPEDGTENVDHDPPDARELIAGVVRPFVEALPERYREAVRLSELDGLNHAAVAERLGLSVSGVKSRVQRGREQLRAMLHRCCEIALDARGGPMKCEVCPDGETFSGCCGDSAGGCGQRLSS